MFMISFLAACGICMFPYMVSPVGMVATLVWVGALAAVIVGLSGSSWYSYILFLVFIGGLLVLLVYLSLLLSNTTEVMKVGGWFWVILAPLCVVGCGPMSKDSTWTGGSLWSSSLDLLAGGAVSLYLLLVVFLFVMLLGVVAAVMPGSSLLVSPS